MRFVRDGFSPAAALLPPLWMAAHGLWLVLMGYVVSCLAIFTLAAALGTPDAVAGGALIALNIIVGFEAASLVRWSLDRLGWQEVGVVTGSSAGDCERRFFDAWLSEPGNLSPRGDGRMSVSTEVRTVAPASWMP